MNAISLLEVQAAEWGYRAREEAGRNWKCSLAEYERRVHLATVLARTAAHFAISADRLRKFWTTEINVEND